MFVEISGAKVRKKTEISNTFAEKLQKKYVNDYKRNKKTSVRYSNACFLSENK